MVGVIAAPRVEGRTSALALAETRKRLMIWRSAPLQ